MVSELWKSPSPGCLPLGFFLPGNIRRLAKDQGPLPLRAGKKKGAQPPNTKVQAVQRRQPCSVTTPHLALAELGAWNSSGTLPLPLCSVTLVLKLPFVCPQALLVIPGHNH